MKMMLEIGACSYTQNHVFDTDPVKLNSCIMIKKFEAKMSKAFVHVDSENLNILPLTASGRP